MVVDVSAIDELSAVEDEFTEHDKAAEELEFKEDNEEFKKDSGLCLQEDAPWTCTTVEDDKAVEFKEDKEEFKKAMPLLPNEAMPPPPSRPPKQLHRRVAAKEAPKKKSPVKKKPTKRTLKKSVVKTVVDEDDDVSSFASFSSIDSVSSRTRSKKS